MPGFRPASLLAGALRVKERGQPPGPARLALTGATYSRVHWRRDREGHPESVVAQMALPPSIHLPAIISELLMPV